MINWNEERKVIKTRQEVVDEIKEILIDSLMLFGRGLELDSIDALELSIGISTTFGVELNDDDMAVLSSINKLADFVIENSEDIICEN